jgi:hypothetical protein
MVGFRDERERTSCFLTLQVPSVANFDLYKNVYIRQHVTPVDILSQLHSQDYRLDGPGSIPSSARFFSSPQIPNRLWGPPSLLSNGYRGLFSRGRGVKLTTHLHLAPRSRKVELFLHSPICVRGIVLN